MALGAKPSDVLGQVIGEGLTLAIIGTVAGLLVALAVSRLMIKLLFELSASDPLTFAAVALLLIIVSTLACYLPARRATKVNPMVALRCE